MKDLERIKKQYEEIDNNYRISIRELQAELDDLSKEYAHLDKEDPYANDLNKDGVDDITYEFEDDFNYDLVDTNFDGKIDERWKYNNEYTLLEIRMDQDRNGVFETDIKVVDGSFVFEVVDSNENGINDIYSKYDHGVVLYSEKYYRAIGSRSGAKIGRVEYKFGYPNGPEEFEKTNLTEKQFESSRVK